MTDNQLVEEVPGLYGALRVEEKVVQKIWADQDFDKREMVTECGKKVIISSPGIWNLAEEGPDFKNASISLDNSPVDGDIEIHFNSSDWEKHGHHKDVNYNRVLLHVTFFPQNEKKVRKKWEKRKFFLFSISKHFNVSKSTVSNMIKKLVVMDLIDSKPYKPIVLTKNGKKAAVEIIAKHRLIELYLVEEMQFSLDEVHEIAEEIEHIKNTKFFIRMQEILGDAQLDPHGSVIPKCDF